MIAMGCDHRGIALKQIIIEHLKQRGESVIDCGYDGGEMADYPVFIKRAAKLVQSGECACGVVICGTGIGASIVANKIRGVRCALCNDVYSARYTKMHNNANIISLGADVVGPGLAKEIVDVWLDTQFEGGRHQRRLDLIEQIEKEESRLEE